MDDGQLLSISEVSRRTGLTIKAIRRYADRGIVPPARRNAAGQRVYDDAAVAMLHLVGALRSVGLGLPTIARVVAGQTSLHETAAAHAHALELQIRILRLRHAVLTAVAARKSTPEEMQLMNELANLSELGRLRLIDDFLDDVFGDDPAFTGMRRSLTPELPDDAGEDQLAAWVGLGELMQDNAFRRMLKVLAAQYLAGVGGVGRHTSGRDVPTRDLAGVITQLVAPALAAGIGPSSARAEPIAAAVVGSYPTDGGDGDTAGPLLEWLAVVNDPRRERYLHLLSVVNEWPPPDTLTPVFDWAADAIRARQAG